MTAKPAKHRTSLLTWIAVVVLAALLADLFSPFRAKLAEIELAPKIFWHLGPLPISNTLLCSWLAMILLAVFSWCATRHLTDVPAPRSLQNVAEIVIEALYKFTEGFAGPLAKAFFPVTATFFLYILTANWVGLLPGIGSIGFWYTQGEAQTFVPLLRGATADLNTTVALAICSVLLSQAYGIRYQGIVGYLSRFLNLGSFFAFFRALFREGEIRPGLLFRGLLDLFIGPLELLEELTKVLSFSFRLFGNIFGGEVLLAVIAFLAPFLAPLPFMALEMLAGFIQALVFAALSTAFFARAATPESPDEEGPKPRRRRRANKKHVITSGSAEDEHQ